MTPEDELNYYATPPAAVRVILPELRAPGWLPPHLAAEGGLLIPKTPRTWCDPGFGTGEISRVILETWREAQGWGVEKSARRWAQMAGANPRFEAFKGDWLDGDWIRSAERQRIPTPDVTITNGPFAWPESTPRETIKECGDLWSYWVQHCRARNHPKGEVAALGRLNLLQAREGSPRDVLFDGDDIMGPTKYDVFPLAWRPSFGNGKTDSDSYAWFVFGPTREGKITRLHRLDVDRVHLRAP